MNGTYEFLITLGSLLLVGLARIALFRTG